MHHHNNVRNPHQAVHNPHIRPHNPMNMMPPRSQIIPFISSQQPRDINRLGPHISQQHSQQLINSQMHQVPQVHHSKNRLITNHNNTINTNNINTIIHGAGVIPGSAIKQQQSTVHPQILQNLSHNYQQQQKVIPTVNHHGKSTIVPIIQQNLNDDKIKEQTRNVNDSIQSHNQQQQHNTRRNIPNHILASKQNHLSQLPQQQPPPPQQQQQPPPAPPQQQQQPQQKLQKPQPKITLLNHNNSNIHQKILKNLNIRNSPSLIPTTTTAIPNVVTTSTKTPKSTLTNTNTKIINVQQSNCPVPIISSQQQISTTIPTSVVANCNSSVIVSTKNPMAPVSPIIDQTTKQTKEKYTCGQILQSTSGIENYTNSKEKTPMCLVNELARYNKITHQYRLTGEQGPAHSKRFTVTLKLGDEEYTADGPSIKKTQHTAASEAIAKTKYDHPPPKTVRHKNGIIRTGTATITPTVELNALAMKLGEPTIYVFDPSIVNNTNLQSGNTNANSLILPPHHPLANNNYSLQQTQGPNCFPDSGQYQYFNHRNNIYLNRIHPRFPTHRGGRGAFGQRGTFLKYNHNPRLVPFNGMLSVYAKDACKITLMVGKKKFVGIGPTIQSAKHDAAARALEILKPLGEEPLNDDNNITTPNVEDANTDIKSPISLVHEMALKRNLNVIFDVKSETGPPHMKIFITICTVGTTVTEGEGNGKKISKKRAAEKMLEELRKLPPIINDNDAIDTPNAPGHQNSNTGKVGKVKNSKRLNDTQHSQVGQITSNGRKKSKNLIKENKEPDIKDGYNPISKLIQVQQTLKEREPIYTILEERGAPRRREFIVEVTVGSKSTKGVGYSKKLAKKNAAKNLLKLMGYDTISNPNKENDSNVVNTAENANNNNSEIEKPIQSRKDIVTSSLNNNSNNSTSITVSQSGHTSRQIVPGIIHLPQKKINSSPGNEQITQQYNKNQLQLQQDKNQQQDLSDNLNTSQNKEVINESPIKSNSPPPILEKPVSSASDFVVRPKDQLLYLAQLLGFQAVFSDYPKGNHGEYLTIVTLSTDPPQICHGAGADTDASQDMAARTALQMLSKLGLDNVTPKEKTSTSSTTTSTQKISTSKVLTAAADSSKN